MVYRQEQGEQAEGSARQFALPLRPPQDFSGSRFVSSPSNAQARAWLAQTAWPEHRLWLWGAEGCGKTHMLHLWAENAAPGAALLDSRVLGGGKPEALAGELPQAGVALDNADSPGNEEALLHFLNTARERRIPVLLAGRLPPARVEVRLPDLASRLRGTSAVQIAPPDDAVRATLLMRLLAERQIVVSQPVMDWLLLRLPRTGGAIVEAVARLDGAALAHGRPVTRALARSVLDGLVETGEDPSPEV